MNRGRGRQGGMRERDFHRVAAYKQDQAVKSGQWSDQVEVEEQTNDIAASRGWDTPPVQQASKKKSSKPKNSPKDKGKTETPPVDETIFDFEGFCGTKPTINNYSQNFDLAGLPLLLDATYEQMASVDMKLRREMPFCLYQHAMFEAANAVVMHRARFESGDSRFDEEADPLVVIDAENLYVHEAVDEFFQNLGLTTDAQGDKILMNLPEAGTPQYPQDLGEDEEEEEEVDADAEAAEPVVHISSGSFGAVGEHNHNAYECYPSPLVSRRLVEATLEQNTRQRFEVWQPLPDGAFPARAIPNQNFVGWRMVERLTVEGQNRLQGLVFSDAPSMAGRLAHCSEIIARVNTKLESLMGKVKIRKGIRPKTVTPNNVGFARFVQRGEDLGYLSPNAVSVHSPMRMGSNQTCKVEFFTLKRERDVSVPGVCYTLDGGIPFGWADTINSNFEMEEPFQPVVGVDSPSLREDKFFEDSPEADRRLMIMNWLLRHFKKKQNF